ncbi:MAG: hypothetical protein ACLSVD_04720 [Eggerthellaceae bacterium]
MLYAQAWQMESCCAPPTRWWRAAATSCGLDCRCRAWARVLSTACPGRGDMALRCKRRLAAERRGLDRRRCAPSVRGGARLRDDQGEPLTRRGGRRWAAVPQLGVGDRRPISSIPFPE